jgi:hypothetical protein
MKKLIFSLFTVCAVFGIGSIASANECGTLEVSQFDGQYEFVLDQGQGALELTVGNAMSQKMSAYNGKQVCVAITGTRDAYGDEGAKVTAFYPQN